MANPNNTDPKYWEKQLRRYGLGIYQPMTDNSEGEMAESDKGIRAITNRGHERDFGYLRSKLDGNDGFMDGHQIQKVRQMEREVPEWAMSNEKVQRILLTAFPKMLVNKRQEKRASKWSAVIYLYYRMKLPKQVVARELGIDQVLLTRWIQKITFTSQGRNVNGKPRRHPSNGLVRESGRGDEHIKSPLLPTAGTGSTGKGGTAS